MDMQTIVLLIVAAAALIMAGVGLYSVRRPLSVPGVLGATGDALSDIETAAGAAREYVLAAEQMWVSGRIDKESRLNYVLDRLVTAFPGIPKITLIDSIEAAVAWMKLMTPAGE